MLSVLVEDRPRKVCFRGRTGFPDVEIAVALVEIVGSTDRDLESVIMVDVPDGR